MTRWFLLTLLLIGTLGPGCDRTSSPENGTSAGPPDTDASDSSESLREEMPDASGRQAPANAVPTFETYSVEATFDGEPSAIDFESEPDAKRFRTRLTRALESHDEHRFAGHYTVAVWGCGSPCQQSALIDLRDGKVTFGPTASLGYEYRPDSRLFVVNPRREGESVGAVHGPTEYYVLEEGEFRKLFDDQPDAKP